MRVDPDTLRAFVEGSGLSYRQNSVSWIFTCPRCSKRGKLYIRKRDGRFVCWVCAESEGYQGYGVDALSDLTGLPRAVVRDSLYGNSSFHVPHWSLGKMPVPHFDEFVEDEDELLVEVAARGVQFPLDYLELDDPAARKGLEYLEGRGVDLTVAKEYDIRYHPAEQRVIFPVIQDGLLRGWQGRLVIPHEGVTEDGLEWSIPKALTSKGLDRKSGFMFQDRLRDFGIAVVCEGPMDAIKAHLCGGNICSMGKIISDGQLDVLRGFELRKIYWGLDPDAADEQTRLCKELPGVEHYQLLPPAGCEDLGKATYKDVYQQFLLAPRINAGRVFAPPFTDRRAWG